MQIVTNLTDDYLYHKGRVTWRHECQVVVLRAYDSNPNELKYSDLETKNVRRTVAIFLHEESKKTGKNRKIHFI